MAHTTSAWPELYIGGETLLARFEHQRATFLPGMRMTTLGLSTGGTHDGGNKCQAVWTCLLATIKAALCSVHLTYKSFDSAHSALLLLRNKDFYDRKLKVRILPDFDDPHEYILRIWHVPRQLSEEEILEALDTIPPISISTEYKAWEPHAAQLDTTISTLVRNVTDLTPTRIARLDSDDLETVKFLVGIKENGIRLSEISERLTGHTLHESMRDLQVKETIMIMLAMPPPVHLATWMRLWQITDKQAVKNVSWLLTANQWFVTIYGDDRREVLSVSSTIQRELGLVWMSGVSKGWKRISEHDLSMQPVPSTCQCCLGSEEDGVDVYELPCGHFLCRSCLKRTHAAYPNGRMDIKCFQSGCEKPIPPMVVGSILGYQDFVNTLRKRIMGAVARQPKVWAQCVGADCQTVFLVHPGSSVQCCLLCGTVNCTTCRTEFHPGQTCEETTFKRTSALFDEAAKHKGADKDRLIAPLAKCCTVCRTLIVKTDGCNHMYCDICSTHFCWTCMQTFENAEDTYQHQPYCDL